jgi:hypothetical protein
MLISKVTLVQLIALNKKLKPLDDEYKKLTEDTTMNPTRRGILLTNIFVKKASITFTDFDGKSTPETQSVDFLVLWYQDFLKEFDMPLTGKWWESIGLCAPELTHMSPISFGQFIDAKMMVDGGTKQGVDRWQTLQYLMAIFLVGKSEYKDEYTFEEDDWFILCGMCTLDMAIKVSKWWDILNQYVNDHYTVFQDSGDIRENCENVDDYMSKWGWVNFLMSVAKTKAFDISGSGMNSIDCVRKTKASEVLIWASAEKDYNVATNRDTKAMYKNT